jgi:hypothetical protein
MATGAETKIEPHALRPITSPTIEGIDEVGHAPPSIKEDVV